MAWLGLAKTQLVIEYGHRFAGDYDLCWWIDSEQPELVGEQLTALAAALHAVKAEVEEPQASAAVKSYLGEHDRWLLIFDNVDGPGVVREWLPSGPGHVLITSRHHVWGGVAEPLPVNVFARAESIALLCRHVPRLTEADADRLADALGDLPLAVTQAAVCSPRPASQPRSTSRFSRICRRDHRTGYPDRLSGAAGCCGAAIEHKTRRGGSGGWAVAPVVCVPRLRTDS